LRTTWATDPVSKRKKKQKKEKSLVFGETVERLSNHCENRAQESDTWTVYGEPQSNCAQIPCAAESTGVMHSRALAPGDLDRSLTK
jgi:hypothetical protein